MNDYLDQPLEAEATRKRPVLLLVLSILTYIGALIMIAYACLQLYIVNQMKSIMGDADLPMYNQLQNIYNWTIINSYLVIANCVLTVIGAIIMFRLRKWGFYVYATGQLLLIIGMVGSIYFFKSLPGMGALEMLITCFPALLSVIFTVLYAVNLKHMR